MTARSYQPEVPCSCGIEQGQQFERANRRKIGIYRQAPTDYPEFAQLLVEERVNLATVQKKTVAILEKERKTNRTP